MSSARSASVERHPFDADLRGTTGDAGDARVRHLHVEDGVLHRLRRDHVEIDGLPGVERLQQERQAGDIRADGVEQIVEQHEIAGPLRQAHRLAVAYERHELAEDDLELVRIVAEGVHTGLQPRHVAVVVRTPDVDQQRRCRGRTCRGGRRCRAAGRSARRRSSRARGPCRRRTPVVRSQMAPSSSYTAPCARRSSSVASTRPSSTSDCSLNHTSNSTPMRDKRRREVAAHPLVAPLGGVDAVGHLRGPLLDVVALVAVLGHGLARPWRPRATRRTAPSACRGRSGSTRG